MVTGGARLCRCCKMREAGAGDGSPGTLVHDVKEPAGRGTMRSRTAVCSKSAHRGSQRDCIVEINKGRSVGVTRNCCETGSSARKGAAGVRLIQG